MLRYAACHLQKKEIPSPHHCIALQRNAMQVSWRMHALKNAAAGGEAFACLEV